MDVNKHVLVTNNGKQFENYNQYDWDTFLQLITSETSAFSVDFETQKVYIDATCVPDEDTAAGLAEAFPNLMWIAFDQNAIQPWFTFSINPLPEDLKGDILSEQQQQALNASLGMMDKDPTEEEQAEGQKQGRIITFGSAKGGSGKTFTSIITAKYYADDHPEEKVCLLDLDVEEPQVALVIKKLTPNIKQFYTAYKMGDSSFEALKKCKVNGNNMPKNLDFYLTPRDANPITDEEFWKDVMMNLMFNYDMIFFDTGTTYMKTKPIVFAYQAADKICLVTMASLASSVAVSYQIKRLTGEQPNDVYTGDDAIPEEKINLIITNSYPDLTTESIVNKMGEEAPIIACFGNLHAEINRIQILGEWKYYFWNWNGCWTRWY